MASLPYFVLSPNTIASMIGFVRDKKKQDRETQPFDDWRGATVDIVIPARNEEEMILLCLASILRQTYKPRRIVVVDDGSTDRTAEFALAFANAHKLNLVVIRRKASIGKTVTLKRQAREMDSDVMVVLDADTILDSDNYVERLVQELYKGVGVASVCGTVRPLTFGERGRLERTGPVLLAAKEAGGTVRHSKPGVLRKAATGITNLYRDVLYTFLQRFIYRGEMYAFGSIVNPVGCAVAYRRAYLAQLFDEVEPEFGDDITNSEDIFIGFALLTRGYRNVQLPEIYAKTVEPPVHRLPRQIYMWSSSFLQSCYYFDDLLRSPARLLAHLDLRRRAAQRARRITEGVATAAPVVSNLVPRTYPPTASAMAGVTESAIARVGGRGFGSPPIGLRGGAAHNDDRLAERRRVAEPYRQAFGVEHTRRYGRPMGWFLATSALEKISFPTVLLLLAILGNWNGLALTVLIETLLTTTILVVAAPAERIRYFLKGIAVTPVRYGLVAVDAMTISWFAVELWVSKNRKWRK